MSNHAIDVRDATKRYGDVTALDEVSLSVDRGSTFGLLGTNGAGKTTLFRLLIGHDRPDAGSIEVAGRAPADGRAVRRRVGYLPEGAGFPARLTGREVLSFHAAVRGIGAAERADRVAEVLETVGLAGAADRAVGGYSHGMNRRLGLAAALVGRPAVLLLDEPTAGLDPTGIDAFHRIVERLAAETDATIVFTSHALAEVERVAERVAILEDGRVRAAGPTDELRFGAGEDVSIAVRVPVGDADRAAATARRDGRVDAVEARGDGRLAITCPRSAAFEVLSAIHEAVPVEGFEVREPGLADAFRQAVGSTPNSTSGQPQTPAQVAGTGGDAS